MIYVIGKSGYIGRSLLEYFGEAEAVGIGRCDPWPEFGQNDCIVNCAAYGWNPGQDSFEECIETNILLPLQLEKARNGAGMIYFASGMQKHRPEIPYSLTKNVATRLLEGKAHILILYTVYGGKYDPPWRFMGTFLRAVRDEKPYTITTPFTTRDFVHIDRLCKTVQTLAYDRKHRTIDFGSGQARSLLEVYDEMRKLSEKSLSNVRMLFPETSEYDYCAEKPELPDTFVEDLRLEWDRLCKG